MFLFLNIKYDLIILIVFNSVKNKIFVQNTYRLHNWYLSIIARYISNIFDWII